ncbi:hypothetical protein AMS68_003380 [Peltaster fructicola]|uniref:Heterokaryon incompatibility domain-containing protein n=1 Tax=Peltaster fructicola TaxID=286661 RepID=A0A6H0XT17_9PEZI|nr:hypothetical protein AMS68_003380 [Peltaster fructicola]
MAASGTATRSSLPSIPSWATPRAAVLQGQHENLEEDGTGSQNNSRVYGDIPVLETTPEDLMFGPRIRLLSISPAKPNDCIRARLLIRSLFDAPPYLALSYSWGCRLAVEQISIDGVPFAITRHLWQALRALRSRDRSVVVWVDAICINQENPLDKSLQVQCMAQVYNEASEVRIWLGQLNTSLHASDVLLFYELSLLSHPWWKRLWVVQECAYAKTSPVVMLRPTELTTLGELVHRLSVVASEAKGVASETLNSMLASLQVPFDAWDAQRLAQTHRIPLSKRLSQTKSLQCSVPHDRLYAILSLAEEDEVSTIVPDYNKSYSQMAMEANRRIKEYEGWDDFSDQDLLPPLTWTNTTEEKEMITEDSIVYAAQCDSLPLLKYWQTKLSRRYRRDGFLFNRVHIRALCVAAGHGHLDMVRYLLEGFPRNAALLHKQFKHDSPVQYASRTSHTSVVRSLLVRSKILLDSSRTATIGTPLIDAAANGHLQMVTTLLEAGAQVNDAGGYFGTALQAAVISGDQRIVDTLLAHGARVDQHDGYFRCGYFGDALRAAIRSGHESIALLLQTKRSNDNTITQRVEAQDVGGDGLS